MTLKSTIRGVIERTMLRLMHPSTKWVQFSKAQIEDWAKSGFHSQHGQDAFLHDSLFGPLGIGRGFFLDVGCNHPQKFNNTLAFEAQGWEGVAIDPLPLAELWATRKARFVQCAVGSSEGRVDLDVPVQGGGGGAPLDMFAAIADSPGKKHKHFETARINVRQSTLTAVLDELGVRKVDLLSCDVEGYEEEALAGMDFAKIEVGAILVENDGPLLGLERLRRSIIGRGFVFYARIGPVDDLFLSRTLWCQLLASPST